MGVTEKILGDYLAKQNASRNTSVYQKYGQTVPLIPHSEISKFDTGANSYIGLLSEGLSNIRSTAGAGQQRYKDSVKAIADAEQKAYDRKRQKLSDDKMRMEMTNLQASLATKRNNASIELEAKKEAERLFELQKTNAKIYDIGLANKWLEKGNDDKTYSLTEEGRKNLAYSKDFHALKDVSAEARIVDRMFEERRLKNATNSNLNDDFEFSGSMYDRVMKLGELTTEQQTSMADELKDLEIARAAKEKEITGKMDVTAKSIHTDYERLDETLNGLPYDALDNYLMATYRDPEKLSESRGEANRLKQRAKQLPHFADLSEGELSLVLAQILKDYNLVDPDSGISGAMWFVGQWEDGIVDKEEIALPYINSLKQAKLTSELLKKLDIQTGISEQDIKAKYNLHNSIGLGRKI